MIHFSKCLIVIILFLCNFVAIYAQEPLEELLTKEDAFNQMLQNNFGIQIADNNIVIAKNSKSILNTGFLPSLSGNAGGSFDQTDTNTNFNGAVDQEGNPRPDIALDDAETRRYNASLNLDYILFDGLGRTYIYKQLKEEYNLSTLRARETIELTAVQLLSVYYEIARLTENENVLKSVLKASKDREERASYRFEYGQTSKLEVLNAQVNITTDSINLLNTKQQLKNTKRDLNVLLNTDLEKSFAVDTTLVFLDTFTLKEFAGTVLENNVTLLQSEKDILISDYQIKRNRALMLPSIGLTGSYGWNRNYSPASAFFPGTTSNANSLNAGINLRWNLFDGGQSITAVKNAKIVYQNRVLEKSQVEQEVYRDLANARGNYENALLIFDLQTQNVRTNEDNFERSQEQFKMGQITSIEFRQAQLNLLNAQTTKNGAKYTAKVAEIQWLQLVGQLLNVSF
ncbi:MAG: outer membrane protein [Patiriisocius sp.]|jgi:outer membrane protein TolC